MPSVLEGWREFRREIEMVGEAAAETNQQMSQALRTQTDEIAAAAEATRRFREEEKKQQEQSYQHYLRLIGKSEEYIQASEDGVITKEEMGRIQAASGAVRTTDQALPMIGGVMGSSGNSSGGGGGGRSGPSGGDGDPVSCRIPDTDNAINSQTEVLSGWLAALFEEMKNKSYPGHFIGKPLWMRF